MTHPRITQGLYMRAFGEVHMMSHIAGRQWQADSIKRVEQKRLESVLDDRKQEQRQCQDDLCGRCVLYVGGQAGSQSNYRQLVEGTNGKFLHHGDGREDSRNSLAGLINQADTVVCPASCVSHTAMHKIKQVCAPQKSDLAALLQSDRI